MLLRSTREGQLSTRLVWKGHVSRSNVGDPVWHGFTTAWQVSRACADRQYPNCKPSQPFTARILLHPGRSPGTRQSATVPSRRSVLIQTRQLTKIEGRSGPGVPSEPLAQNFPGSEADLQPIWVVTTRNGFASTGRLV